MKVARFLFIIILAQRAFAQCPPQVQSSHFTQTLTCNNPTVLATGSSTTPNTVISWIVPSTPSVINSATVNFGPPNGPPTTSTQLAYANYTVVATNTLLSCVSTSIVIVSQDFRGAYLNPATSGPPEICKQNALITVGTSSYSHYTPNGPAFVIATWMGPVPQVTAYGISTYSAFVPGIYTMSVNDSYTGCNRTATLQITDSRPQFGLSGTTPPSSSVSCDGALDIFTQIPNGYTLSTTSGLLNANTLTNLCYGWVKVCMTYTNTGCVKCDSLLINGATSIGEIDWEKEVSVYPNPSSGIIKIKYPENLKPEIKIFDVQGKDLETVVSIVQTTGAVTSSSLPRTRFGGVEKSTTSEIIDLLQGVYFIEIRSGNNIARKKLIVIR
jgi:hypothetical protein